MARSRRLVAGCRLVCGDDGRANLYVKELRDVMIEANAYKQGWGQVILKTASEMVNHDRIRERTQRVAIDAAAERKWWDEKRERSSRELLGDDWTSASDSDSVATGGVRLGKV